ncbi:MAG: hypothetical protein AB7G44_15740 [Bacteroidia bacterium]
MKSSDSLHELVLSLSASELRYIKLSVKDSCIKDDDLMIRLLDNIIVQDIYDEAQLKERINNKKFCSKFSSNKNRLQEIICKCLIDFNKSSIVTYEIYKRLEISNILSSKGLLDLALKKLREAKREAIENDQHIALLEILKQKRYIFMQKFENDIENSIKRNTAETHATFEKIKNEFEYDRIYDFTFSILRFFGQMNNTMAMKKLENEMKSVFLKDPNLAITFESKLKYHLIWCNYFKIKKELFMEVFYRQKVIQLWSLNPQRIKAQPIRYQTSLSNLLLSYNSINYYEEFENGLSILTKYSHKNEKNDFTTFRNLYNLKMLYLINTGRFDEMNGLTDKIIKGISQFDKSIDLSFKIIAYYNLAVTKFFCNEYSAALKLIKNIIDLPKTNIRMDIQHFAKFFRDVLIFQMGKVDNPEYSIRSNRRYFSKYSNGNYIAKFTLNLLDNIYKCNSEIEKKKLFEVYTIALETLLKDPDYKNLAGLEELHIWSKAIVNKSEIKDVARKAISEKNISKEIFEKRLKEIQKKKKG